MHAKVQQATQRKDMADVVSLLEVGSRALEYGLIAINSALQQLARFMLRGREEYKFCVNQGGRELCDLRRYTKLNPNSCEPIT